MTNTSRKLESDYTGLTWIQQSLKGRRNTAAIAKELQVPKMLLEDFETGRRVPPDKVLQALATYLTGGLGEYDPAIDLMRSTHRNEPAPLGIKPPQFVPPKVEYVVGGYNGPGPQPVKPKSKVVQQTRPGWTT